MGLKKVDETKPEIALALRSLPDLAFEDKRKIEATFSLIADHITEACDSQDVDMAEFEKLMCCASISRKHT